MLALIAQDLHAAIFFYVNKFNRNQFAFFWIPPSNSQAKASSSSTNGVAKRGPSVEDDEPIESDVDDDSNDEDFVLEGYRADYDYNAVSKWVKSFLYILGTLCWFVIYEDMATCFDLFLEPSAG